MADEIRFKITADADDAIRDTKATSQELNKFGVEAKDAGHKTDQAGDDIARTTGRMGKMSGAVSGMVANWLSFTAIVATIKLGFSDITSAARESLTAIVELGKGIRGLSANLGGKLADEVVKDINAISTASGFDVAGRNQLIEAIAAQTDVNPNLGRAELRQSAERLAQLQRATGVGGAAGFDVTQSLQATLGLTQQQAVDQAAVLLNSGLESQTIQDLAEKAGPVGGQELLARLLAARGEVNLGRAGRALPTIISALTKRDEKGELAKELTGIGITEDQTLVQRIDLIDELQRSGKITQGQFEQAIGGAQNLRLFAPLARARDRQGEATQSLLTGSAVDEIQKLRQSENVRIAERQQQRELRIKLAQEAGAGASATEVVEDVKTGLQEGGFGSYVLGLGRVVQNPGYAGALAAGAVQAQSELDPANAAGGSNVTINNYINNGTQLINRQDPGTAGLEDRRPPN